METGTRKCKLLKARRSGCSIIRHARSPRFSCSSFRIWTPNPDLICLITRILIWPNKSWKVAGCTASGTTQLTSSHFLVQVFFQRCLYRITKHERPLFLFFKKKKRFSSSLQPCPGHVFVCLSWNVGGCSPEGTFPTSGARSHSIHIYPFVLCAMTLGSPPLDKSNLFRAVSNIVTPKRPLLCFFLL